MLRDAWILAIETLSWIELKRLGERLALTKAAKQLRIKDPKAIGLTHRLVSETLRKKNYIDFLLNSVLEPRSLNDLKIGPKVFLQLYCYETKVADGNLEKASRIAQMGRSILGWWKLKDIEEVLGEILSINTENILNGLEETEKIGLQTYHPKWFVKYCFRLLGRGEALKFLEKSEDIPPVYVRLNTLKAPTETFLKNITNEKIILEKVPQLKHTYKLIETNKPLTRTQSFSQGHFYIQDKASCFAAEAADPKPDMTVLDICAAPGAKTTYLAQLMQNKGQICSVDYSKRRMRVWRQEVGRMWVNIAQPVIANACSPLPFNLEADVVVLDPPCTSTGVFAKLPAAKWRLTPKSIEKMTEIQWQMINNCAEKVAKGGVLVYSTCSITVEENEMIIERFLKGHPEFSLIEITPKMGLPGLRGLEKCQRLYPHIHHSNGFFIAKLQKE
ncbi:hypothetical protein MUO98_00505 [Candidatus Bathyarchaeota archaeon]|nr:hypothetical protein [Candidatus Bathyarchaeota archaeon]